MDSAATPSLTQIAAELERARPQRTARDLARHARQRRQIQIMIAASYLVDGLVLLIYAYAGAVPVAVPPAFVLAGLASVMFYLVLSETGLIERFKDHYFVVPQLFISAAIMLAFTYVAPQVGVMFLCTLFTVFNFGSLRSTPWQTALAWTVMTAGLAWLFLLTDKPIGLPHDGPIQRFASMLIFALAIGRCMF